MSSNKKTSTTSRKHTKKNSKTKKANKADDSSKTAAAQNNVLIVNMIPLALSGETNQDSEPFLAVNPANPLQIAGSAFTPDPFGGSLVPIFLSDDGGQTWALKSTVPSDVSTGDITIGFSGTNNLYSGILKLPGQFLLNVLRTGSASVTAPMSVLKNRNNVDQPFVQASTFKKKDRVYVGSNDLSAADGKTASIDFSLNGTVANPSFKTVRIEKRSTGGAEQNGPQIRLCVHADGTVYAAFNGWRAYSNSGEVTADVVVVRDDNGGSGQNPFSNLKDTDGIAGKIIAQGITFIWDDQLGQQRLGGDIAVAVDSSNSSIVYAAWAELNPATGYTLRLRRSTDRGVTWSPNDLRTVARATNPAIAVNKNGKIGFLCQRVTGAGASQRWVTQFESSVDGNNWNTLILADVPANAPVRQFQPYIGDYVCLLSIGKDFYGIFSANNSPDLARFPNGVKYQRKHDFAARRLFDLNGNQVSISIDPFFFKVTDA